MRGNRERQRGTTTGSGNESDNESDNGGACFILTLLLKLEEYTNSFFTISKIFIDSYQIKTNKVSPCRWMGKVLVHFQIKSIVFNLKKKNIVLPMIIFELVCHDNMASAIIKF